MHEECLIIDPDSPRTSTVLTHHTLAKQSEPENQALETVLSLQPKDWEVWLMLWEVFGQSKGGFCAHTVPDIKSLFHSGVKLPLCHDSGRFPSRLLLPTLTKNWTSVQLHLSSVMFSMSKCYGFLAIQAFTMKLQYMCTFPNLLQMSVCFFCLFLIRWDFQFLYEHKLFYDISEYTHCSGTFYWPY